MSSPDEILKGVPASFEKALAEGDLLFFPSTTHIHEEAGVKFQIRLCPALQKKPAEQSPRFDPDTKSQDELPIQEHNGGKPDPFSPPYIPNLYIGDLKDTESGSAYTILLNKYSVISHHFLLVTSEFKSQTAPLMPPELVQIYLLLLAGRKASKPFFAFYNCGNLSGASQPHKHVQFLPIDGDDGPPMDLLARKAKLESPDKAFSLSVLPYANHIYRLPSLTSMSHSEMESTLANIFLSLLDLSISTIRHDPDYPTGRPSYNVIMTLKHMYVIPRKHEEHVLQKTGENLSVNALGFAGMLLVKSDEELEAVKQEGVCSILKGVGLQSVHDIQVAGTALEAVDGSRA